MKACDGCKYAKWERTKSGALHPNGEGACTYHWKLPPLPVAMYWVNIPTPSGGLINRKRDRHYTHCPYFQRP
jgi:hypothetical protein